MTDLTAGVGDAPVAKGAVMAHYEKIVDCAAINLAAASHELFDIPAGMCHFSTVVYPLTAEGGTATIDIGIPASGVTDADCLIDGADVNQVATPHRSGDAVTAETFSLQGANAGEVLLQDAQVALLANNALDAAVFRVVSVWVDMRPVLNDPPA